MKLYIFNFLLKKLSDKDKHRILTMAVKELFNTIGVDDILKDDNGKWVFEGKTLPEGIRNAIRSEAGHMLNSKLWKIIENDIKYQANLKMYEKSQSNNDLLAGKLWLYTFDVIKTRLKSLAKDSAKFNQ